MALTVLQIAQRVSGNAGIRPIDDLLDKNSKDALRLRDDLELLGNDLVRKNNPYGGGWTVLTKEYRFTTVAGQQNYALPEDCDRVIDGTVWPLDRYYKARGNLSVQEWGWVRSSIIGSGSISPFYRIRGEGGTRKFSIYPEPVGNREFIFEYVSNGWLLGSDGRFKDRITANDDIPILPQNLIIKGLRWRYRDTVGLSSPNDIHLSDYEMTLDDEISSDAGERPLHLTRRRRVTNILTNFPENIDAVGSG